MTQNITKWGKYLVLDRPRLGSDRDAHWPTATRANLCWIESAFCVGMSSLVRSAAPSTRAQYEIWQKGADLLRITPLLINRNRAKSIRWRCATPIGACLCILAANKCKTHRVDREDVRLKWFHQSGSVWVNSSSSVVLWLFLVKLFVFGSSLVVLGPKNGCWLFVKTLKM